MGAAIMLQEEDQEKIEALRKKGRLKTKVDVVRAGLVLLEHELLRRERIKRWQHAAERVGLSGINTWRAFSKASRPLGEP